MQDEDRRIRRDRIDLIERRQSFFGELMLGKAADDAHPLRRGRAVDLLLQHRHRIGEERHAVPAQLHIVVQPATDDVRVAVDQPGNDTAALSPPLRVAVGEAHHLAVVTHGDETAIGDRDSCRLRILAIQSRELAVAEDQLGLSALSAFLRRRLAPPRSK